MKIKRAIELLEARHNEGSYASAWVDLREAEKLGLEALKRLQDIRQDPEFHPWVLLRGETQEDR